MKKTHFIQPRRQNPYRKQLMMDAMLFVLILISLLILYLFFSTQLQ